MRDEVVEAKRRAIRAAIYTRKSSDEGLDQAFNSLDAQREACAAYIASQRHEGWRELPARYDDGGVSGGTLDRPAIQRLLGEIDAGRVEMVVVYKIDRLTRSLADFAQLVERFDRAGCSFVSVTQAFNTATSMGRLTLNILLSFAQFEREVTGERIRDKIAASKKRGLWMGGLPPLGYDVKRKGVERALVVNPAEAAVVRLLFELYYRHETLREVRDEAARQGLRSKLRRFESGRIVGGSVMTTGQIHYLLCNPVYVGRIRHKDQDYPGLHEPILSEALFARVQEKLQTRSRRRRVRDRSTGALCEPRTQSPLAGRVFDESGDRLTPTHAQRRGRRYRYYVSHRLISLKGPKRARGGWRLPAEPFERAVASAIAQHLREHHDRLLSAPTPELAAKLSNALPALLTGLDGDEGAILQKLVAKIRIAPGLMTVALDPDAVADTLDVACDAVAPDPLEFETAFQTRRRGVEQKIVLGRFQRAPDENLIRTIAAAHLWLDALRAGTSMAETARRFGRSPAVLRQRVPLALLSPEITKAILEGRQPPELTVKKFLEMDIPLCWRAQARLLGFKR